MRTTTGANSLSSPEHRQRSRVVKTYSAKGRKLKRSSTPASDTSDGDDPLLLSPTKSSPQTPKRKQGPVIHSSSPSKTRGRPLARPSSPEPSPTKRASARLAGLDFDSVDLSPPRKKAKSNHSPAKTVRRPSFPKGDTPNTPTTPSRGGRKRKVEALRQPEPTSDDSDEDDDESLPALSPPRHKRSLRSRQEPFPVEATPPQDPHRFQGISTRFARRKALVTSQVEVVVAPLHTKRSRAIRPDSPVTPSSKRVASTRSRKKPVPDSASEDEQPLNPARKQGGTIARPEDKVVSHSPDSSPERLPSIRPTYRPRDLPSSQLPSFTDMSDEDIIAPSPVASPRKKYIHTYQACSTQIIASDEAFQAQKRRILKALHTSVVPADDYREPSANELAHQQLSDLLAGTTSRGEGNSCFLLGPRGSGKTKIVDDCIREMKVEPIVIRLSGWIQSTDRHAMREMATQLTKQSNKSFMSLVEGCEEEDDVVDGMALPPSQLPSLISSLSSLPRPTIVVLDAVDLLAMHPRQSLLYCLFDTVQNCRGAANQKGLAVIGVTSRVDTINLLEKRVKSRFSGRMLRTAGRHSWRNYMTWAKTVLQASPSMEEQTDHSLQWNAFWSAKIEKFIQDKSVQAVLRDTFCYTRDFRLWLRLFTCFVMQLETQDTDLQKALDRAVLKQRIRPSFPYLKNLPYAFLCLLVAACHRDAQGFDVFNFQMLHESFSDQQKASKSAPIHINGAAIGMTACSRPVLIGAFESLKVYQIFVPASPSMVGQGKEYGKYRCTVDRVDIKEAVDKSGQTDLKRWLHKAGDAR